MLQLSIFGHAHSEVAKILAEFNIKKRIKKMFKDPLRLGDSTARRNVPFTLGNYRLVRRIAGGCMAELYAAEEIEGQKYTLPLVVKTLHFLLEGQQGFATLFQREAQLHANLHHPNIGELIEWGEDHGIPYIVLERIEGRNLKQIIEHCGRINHSIPLPVVLGIMEQISRALDYVHEAVDGEGRALQIIHRDISPQNIIVKPNGQVKLVDFGISLLGTDPYPLSFDPVQGKIGYMSPEQVEGKRLDKQTDLFSSGIIFYELLSGQRLFKSADEQTTREKILKVDVPLIASRNHEEINKINPILCQLLARFPEERFPTAHELLLAIRQARQEISSCLKNIDLEDWMREIFHKPEKRQNKKYKK